jgi:hypothetical protein
MVNPEKELLAAGSVAPRSGIYELIGPKGRTGSQVHVLAGRRLPATVGSWELIATDAERRPPEMQVITKGWWTLKEERAPMEDLEQEDRDERQQA